MKEEHGNNEFNKRPGEFGLPEGYFQRSASAIFNKIEWQEEHKMYPALLGFRKTDSFKVPDRYFSKSEALLESIQYPFLGTFEKKHGFSVPGNYFEELSIVLQAEARNTAEEKQDVVTRPKAVKRENAFVVPENYFREKKERLSRISGVPARARIIPLFSKRIGYAAAALVLLLTGAWLYTLYSSAAQLVDCGTIACLDKQDLVKTKNLERLDDEQLYELVDPAVLETKLNTTGAMPLDKESGDSSLNENSLDDVLEDI